MTVKQLIEELQKHPPEARVIVNMGLNEMANNRECLVVESISAFRYTQSDLMWHWAAYCDEGEYGLEDVIHLRTIK